MRHVGESVERKYYIDNLRWITILLLFPFHAAQIWNGSDFNGFYIWESVNPWLHAFSSAISPWFMALLFVLAGMSTRYALQKRTPKAYVMERVKKVLVPLIAGVLLLCPIMTYYAERFFNGYTGSYWQQYILFFTKETDLTGYRGGFTPGHLWFLLFLFVISMVALLCIQGQKRFFPNWNVPRFSYLGLLLLVVPVGLMRYVGDIAGKSLGQFFILFLFGYALFTKNEIMETVKKYRFLSLGLWIVSGAGFVYTYCFTGLQEIFYGGLYLCFCWFGILALLGIGATSLTFHNKRSTYFTNASFALYIFHLPITILIGYSVMTMLQIGTALQFLLITIVSFIRTIAVYEIVRRIPGLRALFGINGPNVKQEESKSVG